MDYQDSHQGQPSWVESEASLQTTKSIWPSCLIGCLVLFLLFLVALGIGGYVAYTRGPAMVAKFVHGQLVDGIRQSELPAEEKESIIHQLDRVVEAFENGEIELRDLQRAAEDLSESPLIGAGALWAVEAKYLEPSGLSDEEKEAARRSLQRVWRGCAEKQIDFNDLQPAMEVIADREDDDTWQLKDKVSDEELREFISQLKSLADENEIPNEPFEVRISDEVRKIVDDLLGPEDVSAEESEDFEL